MNPLFLEINSRRLFCLHVVPATAPAAVRVLVLPPFAEELNKCRPLLALTARRLAASGCEVLLPDLYGCGDSAGDFGEARWDLWIDDIVALDAWLAERATAARAAYLAVRTGALLLAAARPRLPQFTGAHVLLWQPVIDGKRFLQQFLRLRVMSSRIAGGADSLADVQRRLRDGETVEIAGYELAAALADALGAAGLTADNLVGAERISVLEFKASAGASLAQPVSQLLDEMQQRGLDAEAWLVECEQFWTTQEVAVPIVVAEQSESLLLERVC